ncbi:MAG: hypothetical protein R3Y29_03290 [bacterium]
MTPRMTPILEEVVINLMASFNYLKLLYKDIDEVVIGILQLI